MKALITGANGQLARALVACAPTRIALRALPSSALDITDRDAVAAAIREHSPDLLINTAAYNKVDAAETNPDFAEQVNHLAVGYLAHAARQNGARLIQISTDYVFGGMASQPYRPDAPTAPLNIYGLSKAAGETAAGPAALVVRTSWLYSTYGNNFVATMLRLMREQPVLRVVDDQFGTPTSAHALAEAIWDLAATDRTGILHYSDSGVASWYDFAVAIMEEAVAIGLLEHPIEVLPIPASEYPTPATRPNFSVLDKRDTIATIDRVPAHWRANLRDVLKAIKIDG